MKIKRMILVAGLIVVFCLSALPAAALETVPVQDSLRVEPVSLSALAASEIRVERTADTGLVTETTYGNLQAFIEKARAQNGTTDAEIAEELLRATGSADLAEMYTAEELSEVTQLCGDRAFYRLLPGQPGRNKNAGHGAGGRQRKGTRAGRRQFQSMDELGNLR